MLDVVVIGGGPAGLATAIGCRRHGLSVRVLDRGKTPRDKACGEGLMPPAVAALERLGINAVELGQPFVGIRYLEGSRCAEGRFPVGTGVGVRRTELQHALVVRASSEGVQCDWGVRVEGVEGVGVSESRPAGVLTNEGLIQTRFVVGADGLLSAVRGWSGLAAPPAKRRRFGVRRHYRLKPWSDSVEVSWSRRCEAYVTPVGPELVGVAMLWSGSKQTFDSLLEGFPRLALRLEGAEAVSRDRGAGPFEQRSRGVVRGRVALVGDAAGYLDAITGEGIGLALRQAEALSEVLAAACREGGGRLDPYEDRYRRIGRRVSLVTRGLLALDRLPVARRGLVALLALSPGLFSSVLGWMAEK